MTASTVGNRLAFFIGDSDMKLLLIIKSLTTSFIIKANDEGIFVIFVIGLLYLPIAILLWFFVAKDNDISFNLDFKGCNKQYDENILKQSQLIYEQIVKEIIKRRL